MLTLNDPYLAAIDNDTLPEAVIDWLQDRDASLPDVLRLFCGEPPEFVDGLPKAVLVGWVRLTCDRMVSVDGKARQGDWNLTLGLLSDAIATTNIQIIYSGDTFQDYEPTSMNIRDAKRRVLAYFPDVLIPRVYWSQRCQVKNHTDPLASEPLSSPFEVYQYTKFILEDLGVTLTPTPERPIRMRREGEYGVFEQDVPAPAYIPPESPTSPIFGNADTVAPIAPNEAIVVGAYIKRNDQNMIVSANSADDADGIAMETPDGSGMLRVRLFV